MTTGAQAEVYANHFIANHLKVIGGGLTYSQLSAKAIAQPNNAKLAAQVQLMFRGTTLRSMLLNAYAFGTMGTIAGIAAIAARRYSGRDGCRSGRWPRQPARCRAGGSRFPADVDARLDDLAPGDAEILPLQIGAPQSRRHPATRATRLTERCWWLVRQAHLMAAGTRWRIG